MSKESFLSRLINVFFNVQHSCGKNVSVSVEETKEEPNFKEEQEPVKEEPEPAVKESETVKEESV